MGFRQSNGHICYPGRNHLQGVTIFKDAKFFARHYGGETPMNIHSEG